MPNKSFKIARISSAHGIRGEVKLSCFLENKDDIVNYNPLSDQQGNSYKIAITGRLKEQLIARINNISNRNQAEELRGIELYASENARPALAEDEFYHSELIGLAAISSSGESLGTISAIYNFGAGDIIEIKNENGKEILLPLKEPFVEKITKKTIVVTLPEYIEEIKE